MTEQDPSTVSARLTSCPGCGEIEDVEQTSSTPRVAAWKCTRCGMSWAITVVNPQPYFDRLAATVEQLGATRSVLRAVVTLADDAPTITDQQLRDRLVALADRARLAQHPIVQDSGGVTVP
jgi:ribosomal protein L37AE/L43A